MSTKQHLNDALKQAMRDKDEVRKNTIRMTLSSIKLAEIEKKRELSDSEVLAIIQKEIKIRQDVIEESKQANRPDLVAGAEAEIAVLTEFLPAQLTPEELESLTRQVIDELGATSMGDMGAVMKVLVPRLEGRATGQEASQMVRKLLA
jgi:uncharacterized protein YqeY